MGGEGVCREDIACVGNANKPTPFSLTHFLMCAPHMRTTCDYWDGEKVLRWEVVGVRFDVPGSIIKLDV